MRRHQLDPATLTCAHCLGTAEWFAAFPVETPCRDKHETHALVEIWRSGYAKGYDARNREVSELQDADYDAYQNGHRDGKLAGMALIVQGLKDCGHLPPDFDPLASIQPRDDAAKDVMPT